MPGCESQRIVGCEAFPNFFVLCQLLQPISGCVFLQSLLIRPSGAEFIYSDANTSITKGKTEDLCYRIDSVLSINGGFWAVVEVLSTPVLKTVFIFEN